MVTMSEETLFDFLHSEIVNHTLEINDLKNKEAKVCYQTILLI